MTIHIAGDRKHLVRFASGATAELQCDDRRHVAGPALERRVVQHQLLALRPADFQRRLQAVARQRCLEDGPHLIGDPARQALAHGLGPLAGLAAVGRQGIVVADQVGDQLANVAGEVDVLGEAIDDLVGLGQRRATLERQVRGQR